ncbi:MAG: hypothetical protein M1830_000150 [Pleopsidium flavum]|nr:MAG: hypothetical protein M1830_000150 [Pleopsidium flavum]
MDTPPSADSRTASFGKKRQLYASNLDDDTQQSSSDGSISRKRARRNVRTGKQDLRDFVPPGADFCTSAGVLDEHEAVEPYNISDGPSDRSGAGVGISASPRTNRAGLAPSINWNAGSKAKIRTTLGGRTGMASPSLDTILQGRDQSTFSTKLKDPLPIDQLENSRDAISLDSESQEEEEEEEEEEKDDDEANVDALLGYSQAESTNVTEGRSRLSPQRLKTLADLSENDLRMQIRYTAITKEPREIDLNQLVTCLICTKPGHMGKDCPALTCRICEAYNQHFTHACPQSRKCPKCREPGHVREKCPYKLPRIVASEIICDLCQRQGHDEDECEMLWRTFNPQTTSAPSGRIRMACYNCGSSKHFGNDCPSRLPGKPVRSSTWSMKGLGANNGAYRPSMEYSIKGRAGQSNAEFDAGSEDDSADFYRPRVTKAPRGQIRIAGKAIGRNPGISINQARADPQPRRPNRYSPPRMHRDRDDSWKPDSYRKRERQRSFSPQPQYPQRVDVRKSGDRWQPPLPREPVPSRRDRGNRGHTGNRAGSGSGDVYRPMPSAAKNAWVKHRI